MRDAPAADEILCRGRPFWEVEVETGLFQHGRYHSPALQDQLNFGSQEDRADLEQAALAGSPKR